MDKGQLVSRETKRDLDIYVSELLRWNRSINLISPGDEAASWERHIEDSLQLRDLLPRGCHVVDLGSGGGLPGIVIAIMQKASGCGRVDLIESNRKKAGFLQHMIGLLSLPAQCHATRIEATNFPTIPETVTARAVASLSQLFELSERWLSNGAVGLFQKGRDYAREVEESLHNWNYDLLVHPSTSGDGVILQIADLRCR